MNLARSRHDSMITPNRLSPWPLCSLCCALALVTGCAVGPNYSKPDVEVPAQYKEAGDWVVAQPKDAQPKGKWWAGFNDPVLDTLVSQVEISNQDLKAAEARYREARAAVASARSGLFPTIAGNANASRG